MYHRSLQQLCLLLKLHKLNFVFYFQIHVDISIRITKPQMRNGRLHTTAPLLSRDVVWDITAWSYIQHLPSWSPSCITPNCLASSYATPLKTAPIITATTITFYLTPWTPPSPCPNKPDLVLHHYSTCPDRFSQGLTPSYRIACRYGCLILLSAKALRTVMRSTSFFPPVIPPPAPPSCPLPIHRPLSPRPGEPHQV